MALNPTGVVVRSIPAEVMLSLLPKPRAPKPQSFFGMSVRMTECLRPLLLFQGSCCVLIRGRLPGKLGCWPNCSLCNILIQKLLCLAIQKYLCWQGNSFYASTSLSCGEKSDFVLMEDTRFNFSPVLIIKAVKIDHALLFTAFRGLCSGLGEKLKFCLL